jgi:uncharacterized protein (TIGR03437 family)
VLGTEGNSIPFSIGVNDGAALEVSTSAEDGFLQGGLTPPVVVLTARESGREGNEISYSGASSDSAVVRLTTRQQTLCCGNEPFSMITQENPAIPGENIVVFGTGLGLTAPLPITAGVFSGQPIPAEPLFLVPRVFDDFVSALTGIRAATVDFVGLMPGQVAVYQINLRLNDSLGDNVITPLTIAQRLFISNLVIFPVKSLRPVETAIPPPQ